MSNMKEPVAILGTYDRASGYFEYLWKAQRHFEYLVIRIGYLSIMTIYSLWLL